MSKFELPKLNYAYEALEPWFDARTMEIHHTKHHQAYTDNLNNAIAGTDLEGKSIQDILKVCTEIPAVRNNAGGYYNHNLFWEILTPGGTNSPVGTVKKEIETLGGFDQLKEDFTKAAMTRFGSGWAWLCKKQGGGLEICSTANQDNPMMTLGCQGQPIMGLDVWEHAYYLNYQNRRADYVNAFFSLVNWDKVEELYNH